MLWKAQEGIKVQIKSFSNVQQISVPIEQEEIKISS